MSLRKIFALLLLVLPLACGPAEEPPPPSQGPVISEIAPVSPTGSVAGHVVDAFTGQAIAGVRVRALVPAVEGGHHEGVTDEDGAFLLEGVPATDQIALRYRSEGHFEAWDRVSIPSSAGNLAQNNGVAFSGPVALLKKPSADALVPEVIVRTGGAPAGGAGVSAALQVAFLIDGQPRGSLFATVSAAGAGRFALGGLPDFWGLATTAPNSVLRLVVVPSEPTSSPRVVEVSVRAALEQGAVLVDLQGANQEARGDFEIIDSNVADLLSDVVRFPSVLDAADAVVLTFSRPVDADSVFVTAIDGSGASRTVTKTLDGADLALLVTDAEAGQQYYLYLEALPAGAGGDSVLLQRAGFFMTRSPDGVRLATYDAATRNHALRAAGDLSQLRCPADADAVLVLELSEPVGARDGAGAPVTLARLLPARMSTTTAPLGHPMHPGTSTSTRRAQLIAPLGGSPSSGFSRRVRVEWAPIATDQPSGPTTSYEISLAFNDVSLSLGVEDTVVRQAGGAPVGIVQQNSVQVAVREGGCAPGVVEP
jgi:hypothetical protein